MNMTRSSRDGEMLRDQSARGAPLKPAHRNLCHHHHPAEAGGKKRTKSRLKAGFTGSPFPCFPKTTLLFFLPALLISSLRASEGLNVDFGPEGPKSIAWKGAELLASGDLQIEAKLGEKEPLKLNKPDVRAEGTTFTRTWDGLSATSTWTQQADVLKLKLSVRNTGAEPLTRVAVFPMTLRFPRRPAGGVWFWNYNVTTTNEGEPGLVEADWSAGVPPASGSPEQSERPGRPRSAGKLVLTVDEPEKPGLYGFNGNYGNSDTNRIVLETAKGETIAPNAERTWLISLRFAPGDTPTADVAVEVYREFAKRFPSILKWGDRRPIGAIFLARDNTKWRTNPRGWFNDEKVDITTDAGRATFKERLMKHADTCIAELKKTGAQGMIVWDIEGAQMPHAITYLGDPRVLPQEAPEMDAVADEYFKKFLDAGLKTGICIRPSKVIPDGKGGWKHQQVDDHVADMADKIAYAKKRWGCTILYMDTNVKWPMRPLAQDQTRGMWQGQSWLIHSREMRDLCSRHPDVLIFPEFGRFGYYGACGVYGELRGGKTRTDERVRVAYPSACTVIPVGDGDFIGRWDELLDGASKGDIHLFRGWFGDTHNRLVAEMQREIALRRVAAPTGGTLEQHLASSEAGIRYQVLRQLAKPDAAQSSSIVRLLPTEKDWLVQREMVKALGRSANVEAVPLLIELLKDPKRGLDHVAAEAIGTIGSVATKALIELAQGSDQRLKERALMTLGRVGDVQAVPVLLEYSTNDQARLRELAASALGGCKDPASTARLIELLKDPQKPVIKAACEALERQKEPTAVPPLVDLIGRAVKELKDNDIRCAAGRALETITGEQHGPYEQRWKKAMEK